MLYVRTRVQLRSGPNTPHAIRYLDNPLPRCVMVLFTANTRRALRMPRTLRVPRSSIIGLGSFIHRPAAGAIEEQERKPELVRFLIDLFIR